MTTNDTTILTAFTAWKNAESIMFAAEEDHKRKPSAKTLKALSDARHDEQRARAAFGSSMDNNSVFQLGKDDAGYRKVGMHDIGRVRVVDLRPVVVEDGRGRGKAKG